MSKLGVPKSDYEQFPNPPLKAMFGQVRYPPMLKLADPQALGRFQELIGESGYTEFVEEQQLSLTISPEGFSQSPAERSFRFSTDPAAWSVILGPSSFTLEAHPTEYTNFATFSDQFEVLWDALLTVAPPTRLVRQGLRYIDHIERDLEGPGWAKLVNPALLGLLGVDSIGRALVRSVSECRFDADFGTIVLKHGVAKAGPKEKFGYLFDFDYFAEDLDSTAATKDVLTRFNRFHDELHDLFRFCVTEDALKEFRGERS